MNQDQVKQADAFVSANGITPRAKWGARPSGIEDTPDKFDWDYTTLVAHHSGHSGQADPAAIESLHRDRNGWPDIGYHFMIGLAGQIYEGRRLYYKGSHVEAANTGKIGILVMGNFDRWLLSPFAGGPRDAQIESFKKLALSLKGIFGGLHILGGHKDFKAKTECPGDQFYPLLSDLRKDLGMAAPTK